MKKSGAPVPQKTESKIVIPPSLIIAVSIGVVSAGLFGIALELSASDELNIRTDGAAITMVAEYDGYVVGDDILVTLYNSGNLGVDFEDGSYYGIKITQLDGILVFAPQPDDHSSYLGVGQNVQIVWEQQKTDGEQVHSGVYKIRADGISVDGLDVRDSTTVNISG